MVVLKPKPTAIGDVLILQTTNTYTIYAVGRVAAIISGSVGSRDPGSNRPSTMSAVSC